VTAEGVETAEQLETVRAQGVNEAQGYYFSPPIPPDAVERMLSTERQDRTRRIV
jgi:EAL domain-containing protein (putative c-di-GMP-specific phosphodiesterase class I)